jgi:hypothetical protein
MGLAMDWTIKRIKAKHLQLVACVQEDEHWVWFRYCILV